LVALSYVIATLLIVGKDVSLIFEISYVK